MIPLTWTEIHPMTENHSPCAEVVDLAFGADRSDRCQGQKTGFGGLNSHHLCLDWLCTFLLSHVL